MKLTRWFFRTACFILLVVSSVSCSFEKQNTQKSYFTEMGEIFHTLFHVKYASKEEQSDAIKQALLQLNHSANPFDSTSLLYAINNNTSMEVDSIFTYLFNEAKRLSELTHGTYDVTVGPLVNIWGFGFEPSPYPQGAVPKEAIDSVLNFVGFQKIVLRDNKIYKEDPRLKIDFSSIAKGFASDLVAQALYQQGVEDYLVEIGGEIAFFGSNPQGKEWTVAIRKPVLDSVGLEHYNDLETIIALPSSKKKGGLATSGNYHNYKTREDGTIYAHTIDPISGYPVQTDVLSATIIAENCAWADALATASMAMGSKRAVELLKTLPNVDYFFILANDAKKEEGIYHFIASPTFNSYIVE